MRRVLGVYYLLGAVFNGAAALIGPAYVLYLRHCGLGDAEFALPNAAFALTRLLADVPLGILADMFGRRRFFLLGMAVMALGFGTYATSSSLGWFILAEVLLGLGLAAWSNAFEGWALNACRNIDARFDFGPAIARARQCWALSALGGALVGGYLAEYNLALPMVVAAALCLVLIGPALVLTAEKPKTDKKQAGIAQRLQAHVRDTYLLSRSSPVIAVCGLLWVGVAFATVVPNMQWPLLFTRSHGLKPVQLGYVVAGINLSLAAGALIAQRLLKSKKPRTRVALASALVVAGTGVALTPLLGFGGAMAVFLAHEIARGGVEPVMSALVQGIAVDRTRSTMSSVLSGCFFGGNVAGNLALSLIGKNLALPTCWLLAGGALVCYGITIKGTRSF